MSEPFVMHINDDTLCCVGELNDHTLSFAWDSYKHLSHQIERVDVSKLTRVDSAGLSFLTYLCIHTNAKLVAVNSQLQTLIELYDLEPVIL